ncbi:MAG: hypothetical protein WC971_05170 [Coriobacteriia bacterium]
MAPEVKGPSKGAMPGIVLVVAGLVLFALQWAPDAADSAVLLAIGAAFMTVYVMRGQYGLLIPACVLLGIGAGVLLEDLGIGLSDPVPLTLGVGFIAIWAIDLVRRRSTPWWPLVPGGVLVFAGVADDFAGAEEALAKAWPLAIVIVGVAIIVGSVRDRERPADGERTEESGS